MFFFTRFSCKYFFKIQLELREMSFRRGLVSRYFLAQIRAALADSGLHVLNACDR